PYQRRLHSFPTRRSSELTAASAASVARYTSHARDSSATKPALTPSPSSPQSTYFILLTPKPATINSSGLSRGTVPYPTRRSRWRSEEHTSELQSRENLVC